MRYVFVIVSDDFITGHLLVISIHLYIINIKLDFWPIFYYLFSV